MPVDQVAGRQGQQQRRQELGEADQAKIPGAGGQVLHLPAQRHHEHLVPPPVTRALSRRR